MAAGGLLVVEAGGRWTDTEGRQDQLEGSAFVASNGHLHDRLLSVVVDTMPDHLR
jgi:fructose-1,6-bisphosphatase/inositol monophosphatase family enzyme